MTNPADKVERWAIDRLVPYARNARTHSDEQISQIAASIKEWGWTTPVLVDEQGGIIAGHGRTLAAQRLKMTEVPVMVAKGWSDAKKRAYVLADNRLALNAGWDNEMLALELAEIGELGFDLDLIGFNQIELDELFDKKEEEPKEGTGAGSLAGRFLIPPFSVLNAREGWWQDRKRAWIALGIKSEEGRGGGEYERNATAFGFYNEEQRRDAQLRAAALASPGGSIMVAGYKNGRRLVGLQNIKHSNG